MRRGEKVAIVGPSGAGKSTVFNLIMRFYDPSSGTVRFDQVPLRDIDPAALRRRIALVPQDAVIFAGSIMMVTLGAWVVGREPFEPALIVLMQSRFVVVDKH